MKENSYKPQMPDVMEAIFDAAYLLFDLVAAIIISLCIYVDYCNGTSAFILTKYSKNASSSTGGSKLLDCGFRRAGKPTLFLGV